jgi:hypothetical protein
MSAKELFWHHCKWQNPHHSHAITYIPPTHPFAEVPELQNPHTEFNEKPGHPTIVGSRNKSSIQKPQGREQEEETEAGKETNGIAARGRGHNKDKNELSEAFFTK